MHHHHRHDAEGALGLALALAWGAIVAWKTTEQQRGKLGRIQDIKIAEVTSSARSNEDNILALQDAMPAQISTLQHNVLALTEDIDEAVAGTKGRADASFTSAEAEVSAGLAASSDKVAGITAPTLASANAAVDAEIAAQAGAVDAGIQAHLGDWLPAQLKFIGTDVHYNTSEFLKLVTEDVNPGSLTIESDMFIKIPPRTTWAAVATLNYVVPYGYIYLAFRTPDGATQFGHRIRIQQNTSTGIGLKTMVAVLNNPSTTDFLLVGIRADLVSGASSSFLRAGEYSRISLYRTR